jgi:transcriptional regulator with XRE-family HTH domain
MQRFGEKLRTLRTARQMTLKELASALGLTAHGYISEIESGKKKPTAEFVLKVARYFKVTTDQLLKDELTWREDEYSIR